MKKRLISLLTLAWLVAIPAVSEEKKLTLFKAPVADKLFTEYPETNEAANIARVKAAVQANLERHYANAPMTLRDTHSKTHGCAKASFSVNADIPEKFKVGLFSKPATYKTWVRFANGRGSVEADSVEDTRSMSIKLIGVGGPRLPAATESKTQDIITQNTPLFFIRSIEQYADFFEHAAKGDGAIKLWFLNPLHLHEALTLKQMAATIPGSLLEEKYWSGSAFQLGIPPRHIAVKYVLIPCAAGTVKAPQVLPAGYYRSELVSHIAKQEACWNFALQEQTSKSMPIDDLTFAWSEQESPPVVVGKLTMPVQSIDAPGQDGFCENLSFSPWNAKVEHQPIGALNRLRKEVYPMVSAYQTKRRYWNLPGMRCSRKNKMVETQGHKEEPWMSSTGMGDMRRFIAQPRGGAERLHLTFAIIGQSSI